MESTFRNQRSKGLSKNEIISLQKFSNQPFGTQPLQHSACYVANLKEASVSEWDNMSDKFIVDNCNDLRLGVQTVIRNMGDSI